MPSSTRDTKKHAKARKRRYLKAQERLERDCHQAQHAAKVLEQALEELGLPTDLVVFGRNNPSPYTVNGRPLYVHLNGLAIVLLK